MYKFIGIMLWMVLLAACRKNSETALVEKPVLKKIEFHVHAGKPYTEPFYQDVTADVKLEIYKVNYLNGQSQLLWQTSYEARPLSAYPHLPQKYVIEKSFPILESSEKLQAKYNIRYHSAAGISQQVVAEELVPGVSFVFLDVDI